MESDYPYNKKVKMSKTISSIDNKDDLINIVKIIDKHNDDIVNGITENNNGIFMFFHNLTYETYVELEGFLNELNNEQIQTTEKQEYTPYTENEFQRQKGISPKLKYSNTEKNIIRKKNKYERNLKNSDTVINYVDEFV